MRLSHLAIVTAFWGVSEACFFVVGAMIADTVFNGQDLVGVTVMDNGAIVYNSDWG
jgi:hypothetical protein